VRLTRLLEHFSRSFAAGHAATRMIYPIPATNAPFPAPQVRTKFVCLRRDAGASRRNTRGQERPQEDGLLLREEQACTRQAEGHRSEAKNALSTANRYAQTHFFARVRHFRLSLNSLLCSALLCSALIWLSTQMSPEASRTLQCRLLQCHRITSLTNCFPSPSRCC